MSVSSVLARLSVQGVVGAVVTGETLVSCASAPTSLTIPKGILRLGSYCCSGQDALRQVFIGKQVIYVGKACFANCPNLTRIQCDVSLRCFESELKSGNHAEVEYVLRDFKTGK